MGAVAYGYGPASEASVRLVSLAQEKAEVQHSQQSY